MAETRPTPYRLIFGTDAFDSSRFDAVREQAEQHGAVTAAALFMLPAAGELLRDLLPEAEAETRRELIVQMRALLFHAFRHWAHGLRVYELGEAAVRALLTRREPVGEWRFQVPAPAGYVQLPRNLLWARVAEDVVPEPVDGFFWSMPSPDEGARGERLDLLLVLGVRRGRPGLSLIDVGIEAGGALNHWADVQARPDGTDFANILPGGELQGYHALTTQAEVLKLASLCFRLLDTQAVTAVGAVDGEQRFSAGDG